MLKMILVTFVVVLTLTANFAFAGETISIYPSAVDSQIMRFEWSEKITGNLNTSGFVDLYRTNRSFGKAKIGYNVTDSFALTTETRFSSTTSTTMTWVGPQVKVPLGCSSSTTVRYWMRSGKCPDLGTFTKIQFNKKWSLEATINYDLGSSKFTQVEPELVYSPRNDMGLGLRYSQTAKYTEIQLGMKFRI
jgi:hypothetical protein